MTIVTVVGKNLDASIKVRLTVEEKSMLIDDADMAGISMSELVRRRYFGKKIASKVDQKMIAQLNRIGGLLKQIQVESVGAYSAQTSSALKDVQALISEIRKTTRKVTADID